LILTGCSKFLYNVVQIEKPKCATEKDSLTIEVSNRSKLGITNLKIKTINGILNIGGIEAGETTFPIKIEPFYNHPEYEIFILNSKGISTTLKTISIDHIGDEVLRNGYYILKINLNKKNGNLLVSEFVINKGNWN